ncbi:MAG: LapA family protein [Acidimicrobiales bacterium]|jgi:uncharacterized integral membrane protein
MADTTGPTEHNRWDDSPAEPEAKPGILDSRPPAARLTRGYWAAVVVGLVLLLVLLVFILENGQIARVAFFGVHGHLPQGVALLLAAIIGAAFVLLTGAARILQLRVRSQGYFLGQFGGRRSRRVAARRSPDESRDAAGTPPPD